MAEEKEILKQLSEEDIKLMHKKTWMEVFAAYIDGRVQELKKRAAKSVEKTKEKLKILNTAIKPVNFENGAAPTKALESISKELSELSKELTETESATRVAVIEQKIRKLQETQERLQAKIIEIENTPDTDEKKSEKSLELRRENSRAKQKEIALQLREVYRDDTENIKLMDSTVIGQKKDLIEKLSQVNAPTEGEFVQAVAGDPDLQYSLKAYHDSLSAERKRLQLGERQLNTETPPDATEFNRRLKEERQRYRDTAETKDLLAKLDGDDYMSPNQQKRLVQLLNKHVANIQKVSRRSASGESLTDEEKVVLELSKTNTDLSNTTQIKLAEINSFYNEADTKKTNTEKLEDQSYLTQIREKQYENTSLDEELKGKSEVPERQETIKKYQNNLKKSLFGDNNEKTEVIQYFEATNYEKQIETRMSAEIDGELGEFLHGLEDVNDAYMSEFANLRKIEREGPLEVRAELARSFARGRIMEELGDVEKARALYGDKFAKDLQKGKAFENSEEERRENFESRLLEEINYRYGLSKDGSALTADTAEKTAEEIAELNKQAKEIYSSVKRELETVMNNERIGFKIAESAEGQGKEEFIQNTKLDIKLARLKSDLSKSNPESLESIKMIESISDINEKQAKLQEFLSNQQQKGNNYSEVLNSVETLFDNENGQQSYEIISTPNGIALAFKDAEKLRNAVLGDQPDNEKPESLAVTLKSNDTLKEYVNENITKDGEEWDGNVILVATDRGEYELVHEVQHAIINELNSSGETNDLPENDRKIKSSTEELAIKIGTGELWDELSMPEDIQDAKRMSLAALAYITPEMRASNPGQVKQLYTILELSKAITTAEIDHWKTKAQAEGVDEPMMISKNIFGETIADIMMSHRDPENGTYNLDLVIKDLQERFSLDQEEANGERYNFASYIDNALKEIPDDNNFDANFDQYLYGTTGQNQIDSMKSQYSKYSNNPGFDFRVVSTMDTRGRANVAYDAFFDKKIGTNQPGTVGVIPAAEIPILSGLLSPIWNKANRGNPGPKEYHVGGLLSYKIANRAYGGIIRKAKAIPVLGIPFKMFAGPERRTPFAASYKMANFLPPFGRGWELILKDLAPDFNKKLKAKFPGRPESFEANNPNAQELWQSQIGMLYENLQSGALGLSQTQAQRIMGELPGITHEFEMGRLQFNLSRNDYDQLDDDPNHPGTLVHRGRMTQTVIDGIMEDHIKKRPDLPLKEGVDEEVEELAETMMSEYDRNDFPYTMNDLISAAHQAHDLGIDPIYGKVRNTYYETEQDGEFEFDPQTGRMVGQFTWYNPSKTGERGIVINDEMYSLTAAHDLIRRYNLYHIDKTLREGLDDVTATMQSYKHELDTTGESRDAIEATVDLSTRTITNPTTHSPGDLFVTVIQGKQIIIQAGAGGTFTPVGNSFVQGQDNWGVGPDGKLYRFKNVRNRLYNDSPYSQDIPGFGMEKDGFTKEDREAMAKNFLFKSQADHDSIEDGLIEQNGYLNDYVRRVAEISEYERKAYYSKTFWQDTKEWVQRVGKVLYVTTAIGAIATGNPAFAGLFLGYGLFQLLSVNFMQHRQMTMAARRMGALELQQKLGSQMGMYEKIIKGEQTSRLERWYFGAIQSDNEAKMEDLGKLSIPEGKFPGDDWSYMFMGGIFGGEGAVMRGLAS